MERLMLIEPDFDAENLEFERVSGECGMNLERMAGGFYVNEKTQFCWVTWIHRAALAVNGVELRSRDQSTTEEIQQ